MTPISTPSVEKGSVLIIDSRQEKFLERMEKLISLLKKEQVNIVNFFDEHRLVKPKSLVKGASYTDIPNELEAHILGYLTISETINCSKVCKSLRLAANSEAVLKPQIEWLNPSFRQMLFGLETTGIKTNYRLMRDLILSKHKLQAAQIEATIKINQSNEMATKVLSVAFKVTCYMLYSHLIIEDLQGPDII